MDPISQQLFKHQRGNAEKLQAIGFQQQSNHYVRQQPLLAGAFQLTLTVTLPNQVTTTLIDNETQLPYTLHLQPQNSGEFVARVREAYTAALKTVIQQAFSADPFQSAQARHLIQAVTTQYHNDLEFLWQKFPNNAVWRRTDTQKWYAVLLQVSKRKLGLASDDLVTVIDLRLKPEQLATLVDNQRYFPGYHMNKKHWFSIILDDQVSDTEVLQRLAVSYDLAH